MKKKDQKEETKIVKVLEEPSIKHSIDLKMSSSDLVELYIEENKERIEVEAELLFKELETLRASRVFPPNFVEDIILKYYPLDFLKTIIFEKLQFRIESCFIKNIDKDLLILSKYGRDSKDFLNYKSNQYKSDIMLDTNKDISIYNKKLKKITFLKSNHKCFLEITGEEINKDLLEEIEKELSVSEADQITTKERISEIDQKLFALYHEYKEFKNTIRIKSKFTKKALKNTVEGEKLFNFISTIKIQNLLTI